MSSALQESSTHRPQQGGLLVVSGEPRADAAGRPAAPATQTCVDFQSAELLIQRASSFKKICIDLDCMGRDRAGLELLKRISGTPVMMVIRNGRSLDPALLEQIKACGAEIAWDFRALLRHKVELYQQRTGCSLAQCAEAIGISRHTLSEHMNRDVAVLSRTLVAFSRLGITFEERGQCLNLKLLGLEVEERERLRSDALAAIELLTQNSQRYPGDLQAVNLLFDLQPEPKVLRRETIFPVVQEVRRELALTDPVEVTLEEIRSLHREIRKIHDPVAERELRDRQTGYLIEEVALLELQLSKHLHLTQYCASVERNELGEVTRTHDILDAVVLNDLEFPVLAKALADMAVQRGRLRFLDHGRLRYDHAQVDGKDMLQARYRPKDGAQEIVVCEMPSAPPGRQNRLQLFAARYFDPELGHERILHRYPDMEDMFKDMQVDDFLTQLRDQEIPPAEERWERGLPFRAIEFKKAGSRSPAVIAAIKKQLRNQRDALLKARLNDPESIAARISGIEVHALQANPELANAVDELNAEHRFFTLKKVTIERAFEERLTHGEYSYEELSALKRFFGQLNLRLASQPTLVPLAAQYRSLFTGVLADTSVVEEDLMSLSSQDFISKMLLSKNSAEDTFRSLLAAGESLRESARQALAELHDLLDTRAQVVWPDLQRILQSHFGELPQDAASLSPALAARIEAGGEIITTRRVFKGGVPVSSVHDEVLRIAELYAPDLYQAALSCEDPAALERLAERLKLELARKERLFNERKSLEEKFHLALLENKLGAIVPAGEKRLFELHCRYVPSLAGVLGSREPPAGDERTFLEEHFMLLVLTSGERVFKRLFGPHAEAVRKVVSTIANTNPPLHATKEQELIERLHKPVGHWLAGKEILDTTGELLRELCGNKWREADILDKAVSAKRLLNSTTAEQQELLEFSISEELPGDESLVLHAPNTGLLEQLLTKALQAKSAAAQKLLASPETGAALLELCSDLASEEITFADFMKQSVALNARSSNPAEDQKTEALLASSLPALSSREMRSLTAYVLSQLGHEEERLSLDFLQRTLRNAIVIERLNPALAAEYLCAVSQAFTACPEVYHDWFAEKLLAIEKHFSASYSQDTLLHDISAYLQKAAAEKGTSFEQEKGRLFLLLVRTELDEHRVLSNREALPLSPATLALFRAIQRGEYEKIEACDRETAPAAAGLAAILFQYRRNPHAAHHHRMQVLKGMEERSPAPEFRSGNFGRAFGEVLETSNAGLKVNGKAVRLMGEGEELLFTHAAPKDERRLGQLKAAMKTFLELTARHFAEHQNLFMPPGSDVAQAERYRGFRCYGPLQKALATIQQTPGALKFYHLAPERFAAFCGYEI